MNDAGQAATLPETNWVIAWNDHGRKRYYQHHFPLIRPFRVTSPTEATRMTHDVALAVLTAWLAANLHEHDPSDLRLEQLP